MVVVIASPGLRVVVWCISDVAVLIIAGVGVAKTRVSCDGVRRLGNHSGDWMSKRSGGSEVIDLNMGLFLCFHSVGEVMSGDFVADGVVTDYIGLIMVISVVVNEALDEVSGVFVGAFVLILRCIVDWSLFVRGDVEVLSVSRAIAREISSVASVVVVLLIKTLCECVGIT